MTKVKRQVIKIDEDLCSGCGQCVRACAEGAIQVIDGKARLISDEYCDGLGACLGDCPTGAISFEEREAEEFDEAAVGAHLKSIGREYTPEAHGHLHKHDEPEPAPGSAHHHVGCPSARTLDFRDEDEEETETGEDTAVRVKSELRQWPVKLYLVSPEAPYFKNADLLIAADCAPFAYASLHPDYLKGKALVIGCPKFDDIGYYKEKLTQIIKLNSIRSITVLYMEVPCCFGLVYAAKEAVEAAGSEIPVEPVSVSLRGEIKQATGLASLM